MGTPVINGVGKDAPMVINEHGGGQSHLEYAFHLFDPEVMFAVAKVLAEGAAKYGSDNWRLIPNEDHANHLLAHTYALLAGDTSDEHHTHIVCRALFLAAGVLNTSRHQQLTEELLQQRNAAKVAGLEPAANGVVASTPRQEPDPLTAFINSMPKWQPTIHLDNLESEDV